MIRIAIVGDIGSGKSHIAKLFNYPIFNADLEVAKIYKTSKQCFKDLKKKLPKYFSSLPIKKEEIIKAIVDSEKNLKKITETVHPEIRKKLNIFLKNNKKDEAVILDIPLLLENKINKKKDTLVFVESKKLDILKGLKKRNNFNQKLYKKFKDIQLPLNYKKKKSQFIIKNDFTKKSVNTGIRKIIKEIL